MWVVSTADYLVRLIFKQTGDIKMKVDLPADEYDMEVVYEYYRKAMLMAISSGEIKFVEMIMVTMLESGIRLYIDSTN